MIMNISMAMCKQLLPPSPLSTQFPPVSSVLNASGPKEKVVVILGATGTGKGRLSIDLAKRFPSEIINSEKIQMYEGLDIVTNKITTEKSCGVRHHLLGILPPEADITEENFRHMANHSVESIVQRERLPIIVGGSNSFVEALVDDTFRSRYDCCFLWVDVSLPVLHVVLSKRVDKMVAKGMVKEVRELFDVSGSNYSGGIKQAIGVKEFDKYFRNEPLLNVRDRAALLREVVEEIKRNTFESACWQLEEIQRLKMAKKWCVQRMDATKVYVVDADVA